MFDSINDIKRALSLSAILIFVMIVATQMIGLGKGGFSIQSILQQFFFYSTLAVAFLGGILIVFFLERYISKGDKEYGSNVFFASPGENPSLSIFKKFSNFQLFLLFLIIFGFLGIVKFIAPTQTSFIGVPFLEQQFTKTDNVLYATLLIPAAENLGAGFVLAFLFMLLRMYARKVKMSRANFIIFGILIAFFAIGSFGVINHVMRYTAEDINLFIVFIFWGIGGILTFATGSFVPFWDMHIINNLYEDLLKYFSNDISYLVVGILLFLAIMLYFYLYIGKGKKGGKDKSEIF